MSDDRSPPVGRDHRSIAAGPRRPEARGILANGLLFASLGLLCMPAIPQRQAWQAYILVATGAAWSALGSYGLARGALPRSIESSLTRLASWLGVTTGRLLLLLSAPMLSWAAWLAAGERDRMTFPALAVGLWLTSWAAVWVGGSAHFAEARHGRVLPWGETAAVSLLTLGGLAARAIQLDAIPWLFTGDEGAASLTALEFVTGAHNNIFNTAWFSFPALSTYLQSIPMAVFGRGIDSARLSSAIVGAMTIPAVWWCARAVFGRPVALASAAILATIPLHIHISRIALNNIWDALSAAIFVGALYRGWDSNRRSAFLAAGFALGLSQFFYTSARAWFAILPVWLLIAWTRHQRKACTRLPGSFAMGLAAVVVTLPLVGFYSGRPAEFMAPMNRVSIFGEWGRYLIEVSGRTPLQTVWHQIRGAFLGFGPWPTFGLFSPAPNLLPVAAILFWIGVGVLLARRRPAPLWWLLVWPAVTILLAAVSDNPPTSQRYVFVLPLVVMLIALPGCQAAAWAQARWPRWRMAAWAGQVLVVALVAGLGLRFYFGEYTPGHEFGDPNTEVATQVARLLQRQSGPSDVYFFGPPRMGYYSHETIEYLAPEATGYDVDEPLSAPPTWSLTRVTTFIFLPERLAERALVQAAYPGGSLYTAPGRTGAPLFYAYAILHP